MNDIIEMTKDEKNSLAYSDVLGCKEPSLPYDKEYMDSYRFWSATEPERCDPHYHDFDDLYRC